MHRPHKPASALAHINHHPARPQRRIGALFIILMNREYRSNCSIPPNSPRSLQFLSCAINSLCVALLDAGVPLKACVASATIAMHEDHGLTIDPTLEEEQVCRQTCCLACTLTSSHACYRLRPQAATALMVFAFTNEAVENPCVLAQCTGRYTAQQVAWPPSYCVTICISSCCAVVRSMLCGSTRDMSPHLCLLPPIPREAVRRDVLEPYTDHIYSDICVLPTQVCQGAPRCAEIVCGGFLCLSHNPIPTSACMYVQVYSFILDQ